MQTTVAKKVELSGIGLHGGKVVRLDISEAPVDSGIQIRRSDIANSEYYKLTPYNVVSTQLATTVNCGEHSISTIEHFMGSFYGLGIDNAFIDVSGSEVPILDGSAKDIVESLLEVGIKSYDKPRKIIKVTKPIRYELDDKYVEIVPSDYGLDIDFILDYKNSVIGSQKYSYYHSKLNFINDIAFARTFGFEKEVEALRSMGLARGGSLENAIVVDGDQILNPDGLRSRDEFVRHKILDILGDLALIGYRLQGKIRAFKSGHNLNNLFARSMLEATDSYDILEADSSVKGINSFQVTNPLGGHINSTINY